MDSLSVKTRMLLKAEGLRTRADVAKAFSIDNGRTMLRLPNIGMRALREVAASLGTEVFDGAKSSAAPAAVLQCSRCGGQEMIETKTGMLLKDGKASGGTRQIVCVTCLMKGEKVVAL